MIEIIERHTNHISPDPKYQVTCPNCGTIFNCNKSDLYETSDPFDSHFWAWGVSCPVCKAINTKFELIEEI